MGYAIFVALAGLVLAACGQASGSPPDPVDQAYDALQVGHVAYQLPTQVGEGQSAPAIVRISKALPADMTADLQMSETRVIPIKVSDQMTVDLTPADDGLEVIRLSQETQAVGQTDWSPWRWSIIGKQAGTHTLVLALSVLLPSGSKQLPEIPVDVKVTTTVPIILGNLYTAYGNPAVNSIIGTVIGGGSLFGGFVGWIRRRAENLKSTVRRTVVTGLVGLLLAVIAVTVCAVGLALANPIPTSSPPVSSSLPVTPVNQAALDPKQLLLNSTDVPYGFIINDDRAMTEHGWNGWEQVYKSTSSSLGFYWIASSAYVLPAGTSPSAAITAARCDFHFENPAPSSVISDQSPGGAYSSLCHYSFKNGASWAEFQEVVHNSVLLEVGISPNNASSSETLNLLYSLARHQLVSIQNATA